uniref:Uncharacterized protein n=1 Tax=Arundo donax TaxID=35708 RepID=A0A0A9CDP0_ARUDO
MLVFSALKFCSIHIYVLHDWGVKFL